MQIGFVEYNSDKTETLICFVKLSCFLANRKHYILTLKLILRMKQKHAGSFLTGPLKRDQLKKHLESLLIVCRLFLSGFDFVSQQAKTTFEIAPSWFDPEFFSSQHKCTSRYLTFLKIATNMAFYDIKYFLCREIYFEIITNTFCLLPPWRALDQERSKETWMPIRRQMHHLHHHPIW